MVTMTEMATAEQNPSTETAGGTGILLSRPRLKS